MAQGLPYPRAPPNNGAFMRTTTSFLMLSLLSLAIPGCDKDGGAGCADTGCEGAGDDTGAGGTDDGAGDDTGAGGADDTGAGGDDTGPSGDCDAPPTLTAEDLRGAVLPAGCYHVEEGVTFGDKSQGLTIEAGTTITFGPAAGFNVEGDAFLRATGTAEAPILLIGDTEQRGHWAGLGFQNPSSPGDLLQYVTVAYAGGYTWNGSAESTGSVYLTGQETIDPILDHVTIEQSEGFALVVESSGSDLWSWEGLTVRDSDAAMRVPAELAGALGDDLVLTGNDDPRIHLRYAEVVSDQT